MSLKVCTSLNFEKIKAGTRKKIKSTQISTENLKFVSNLSIFLQLEKQYENETEFHKTLEQITLISLGINPQFQK